MRKRALKTAARAAAVLAFAAAVFALSATLFLRSEKGSAAVLAAANRALSSRGLAVSWTGIGLSGFNSVWAENVRVSDSSGELLKSRKVSFGPVIPLLLGKNPPLALSLEGPDLTLSRNSAGGWNIADALARLAKTEDGRRPGEERPLAMERIAIKNGLVKLSMPGFSEKISVNAKASLEGGMLDVKRLVLSDKYSSARISGGLALKKDAFSDLAVKAEAKALTPYRGLWAGLPGLSGVKVSARVKGFPKASSTVFSAAFDPGQKVSGELTLALGPGSTKAGWDMEFENLAPESFLPKATALLSGRSKGVFSKTGGRAEYFLEGELARSSVRGLSISSATISASRKNGGDTLSLSASTAAGGLGLAARGNAAGLAGKEGPVNLNFSARLSKADPKAALSALGIMADGIEAGVISADISGSVIKKAGQGLKDALFTARVKAGPSKYGRFAVTGASLDAAVFPGRFEVSRGRVKSGQADLGFDFKGDFSGNGRGSVTGRVDDLSGLLSLFGARGLSGRAAVDLSASLSENAGKIEISGKADGAGLKWTDGELSARAGKASFTGIVKVFLNSSHAFSGLRADGLLAAENLTGNTGVGRGFPFSSRRLETDGFFLLAPDSSGKSYKPSLSFDFSALGAKASLGGAERAAGRISADFGKQAGSLALSARGLSVSGRRAGKLELSAHAEKGGAVFDLAVRDFESTDIAASGRVGRAGPGGARPLELSRLDFDALGNSYALAGPARLLISSRGVSVSRFQAASKDQSFSLSGLYEVKGRRDISATGVNLALAPFFRLAAPGLSVKGRADFSISLKGSSQKPLLSAHAAARGLAVDRIAFDRASARGFWDGTSASATAVLAPASGGTVTLVAGAALSGLPGKDFLRKAHATAEVSGQNLDIAEISDLFGIKKGLSGRLDLAASLWGLGPDPRAAVRITVRNGRLEGFPELARAEARFSYSRLNASISGAARPVGGGVLAFSGNMPLNLQKPLSGDVLSKTPLRARIEARDLPLDFLSRRVKALEGIAGSVTGRADFSGTPENPDITGKLRLARFKTAKFPEISSGEAVFSYCRGAATLAGVLRPERGGSLAANARLLLAPGADLSAESLKKGKLTARLTARAFDLGLPASFIKAVSGVEGSLDAEALVSGEPGKPSVSATALIRAKSLALEGLARPLADMGAELSFRDRILSVKKFSAKSPGLGGWISGYGTLGFSEGWKPLGLDFSVKGDNLDLAYSGFVSAAASGRIRIGGTADAPVITGAVSVGEGLLRLDKYLAIRRPETVKETDVRFIGEMEPEARPLPGAWNAGSVDLSIKVDGPFWVRGAGAQLQVAGLLGWKKRKGRDHAAISGHLTAVRGVYELSGKTFVIQRGRMDFPGVYPADPVLDVLAEYTVKDVLVRLDVTGRLSAMNLALSSEPAMDEADVASYLLFGKKTSSLTPGQAGNLAEKGAAMLGNQVLAQLRREFGPMVPVDMITVDGGQDGESSTFVVGKQITPDVFVTYRKGTSDQVTVEYRLRPSVVLESQVGEEDSGIDIFYTFEY